MCTNQPTTAQLFNSVGRESTVKPVFIVCPLFHEFCEPGKFTKITGRENLNTVAFQCSRKQQDAQLSQRDRAAGCVIVFAESRRLELGDNILQTL